MSAGAMLTTILLMGELSLDGSIQPIKGALPIAIKAREDGFEGLIIPQQNAREAAVVLFFLFFSSCNYFFDLLFQLFSFEVFR